MTALGYVAGALTTLSFLPQVVRSARMRSAAGLSWLWLLCFGSGVAAWAVYGILRGDPAIIAANSATLLAVLVLVWLRAMTDEADAVAETVTVIVEES
ncbi:MAG TPA: PQ-loop domain-containing transporter [Solirubrobacteraceae bacterium]|jgi:MtN3 and saliva related transmembrane protein|nr:PQ-loop domain-containing transporter [Solirubrobacteraceae bacterium]